MFTLVRGGRGSFLIVFLVYSFPRSSKYCHNLTINQCSNVTFLGKGADKTLISGEVEIHDQKNIVFKGVNFLTGVFLFGKETSGCFSGCSFSGCSMHGLSVDDLDLSQDPLILSPVTISNDIDLTHDPLGPHHFQAIVQSPEPPTSP